MDSGQATEIIYGQGSGECKLLLDPFQQQLRYKESSLPLKQRELDFLRLIWRERGEPLLPDAVARFLFAEEQQGGRREIVRADSLIRSLQARISRRLGIYFFHQNGAGRWEWSKQTAKLVEIASSSALQR